MGTQSLVWQLFRWAPATLLVTMLSAWALVLNPGLARVTGWMFVVFILPWLGALIGALVLGYAAIRRRISRPIAAALALTALVAYPGLWPYGVGTVAYPGPAKDEAVARIRVPLDGPVLVGWGGDQPEHNYHVLYPDQRFAYDLLVPPAFHEKPKLEDYGCYGRPILAPADATVVVAHDGEPDRPPGTLIADAPVSGNHVVLALDDQSYLILAHLRSGSVRVRPKDVVKEGTKLAECGNSGHTSEPHLHIQRQKQDPREFPDGFAEGLPLGFRDHDGPAFPKGGFAEIDDAHTPTGDRIRHRTPDHAPPALDAG